VRRARRTSALGLLAAAVLTSSACSDTPAKTPSGQVEIFSWWAGSEAPPLSDLLERFKARYPQVSVVNSAVPGGGGANARAALRARMLAGKPPDVFQVHAAAELLAPWVRVNGIDDSESKVAPLDALYDAQGWRTVMPSAVLDLVSSGGHPYAVPVDIHKDNSLFYNRRIFNDLGLLPPATLSDFYAVADALKAHGFTALALGSSDPWTLSDIFQNVLLAKKGPAYYRAFWSGQGNAGDLGVADTLAEMKKILAYTNADASTLDWVAAAKLVYDGTAAMNLMGDWEKGYFEYTFQWKPEVDFGEVSAPGTAGAFNAVIDTFGVPRGAPDYDNALALLAWMASREGQSAFVPLKGCLSPRSDVDPSIYDVASRATLAEFQTDALVQGLDSAAPPAFVDAFRAALAAWAASGDDGALLGFLRIHYGELR
jgi:glucose/mannose transport system substrate-binding protein